MPVSEELRTNLSEGTDNTFKVKREEESEREIERDGQN